MAAILTRNEALVLLGLEYIRSPLSHHPITPQRLLTHGFRYIQMLREHRVEVLVFVEGANAKLVSDHQRRLVLYDYREGRDEQLLTHKVRNMLLPDCLDPSAMNGMYLEPEEADHLLREFGPADSVGNEYLLANHVRLLRPECSPSGKWEIRAYDPDDMSGIHQIAAFLWGTTPLDVFEQLCQPVTLAAD